MTPVHRTRLVISVDFHGVICSYASRNRKLFPGEISPDPPSPGAIEWILDLTSKNMDVVIFTGQFAAPGTRYMAMKNVRDWLIKYGIPPHLISIEPDDSRYIILASTRPKAFVTIDDRAIQFRGEFPTAEQIRSFVPWRMTQPS